MGIAFAALLAFGAGDRDHRTGGDRGEARRGRPHPGRSSTAINTQVEAAAEAYNGARYELGQVTDRIDENTARHTADE